MGGRGFAQKFFLPADNLSILRHERAGVPTQPGVHFGIKPVSILNVDLTDVDGLGRDTTGYYYWVTAKLFKEHLIELDEPNFKVEIDPLFNFSFGQELETHDDERQNNYTNTRGFQLNAQIGKRVYLHTSFLENQARFPDYIDRFVDSLQVVPGSGRVKDFK
jgi:hypothetical protein